LKEAGEIFAVNEARIKTSFNFTYEKLDQGTRQRSLSRSVRRLALQRRFSSVCVPLPIARNTAMNSLSQAVQSGARAEATTQARVIVDVHTPLSPPRVSSHAHSRSVDTNGAQALKQKEATHPKESAAIKKASVQLVEATKEVRYYLQLAHQAVRHCPAAAGVLQQCRCADCFL
jgi:hypothetical protein